MSVSEFHNMTKNIAKQFEFLQSSILWNKSTFPHIAMYVMDLSTTACQRYTYICSIQFVTWLLVFIQSYMEDHLKNTERLEQEWTALCNYTPDQCDVEAGKLNPTRNRYPSILPCKIYTSILPC